MKYLLFNIRNQACIASHSSIASVDFLYFQRVTKRCRLSCLTNSALVYMSPNAGGGGGWLRGRSHWVHINFGDLTPYLAHIYFSSGPVTHSTKQRQGKRGVAVFLFGQTITLPESLPNFYKVDIMQFYVWWGWHQKHHFAISTKNLNLHSFFQPRIHMYIGRVTMIIRNEEFNNKLAYIYHTVYVNCKLVAIGWACIVLNYI